MVGAACCVVALCLPKPLFPLCAGGVGVDAEVTEKAIWVVEAQGFELLAGAVAAQPQFPRP